MNGLDLVGPQLAVLITAAIILIVDATMPQNRRLMPFIALIGLGASAVWTASWAGRD